MWNYQWSYEYFMQHQTCAVCGGNHFWEGCQASNNYGYTSFEPSCEQQYYPYTNTTDNYDSNWGNYEQPSWNYEDAWKPQECQPQKDTSLEELMLSYMKKHQQEMKMLQS